MLFELLPSRVRVAEVEGSKGGQMVRSRGQSGLPVRGLKGECNGLFGPLWTDSERVSPLPPIQIRTRKV